MAEFARSKRRAGWVHCCESVANGPTAGRLPRHPYRELREELRVVRVLLR